MNHTQDGAMKHGWGLRGSVASRHPATSEKETRDGRMGYVENVS